MADTKIVGGKGFAREKEHKEHHHRHHDDCDCHADHRTIGGNGSKEHPFTVIDWFPTAFTSPQLLNTIFVRTTGSDKHGDGSSSRPFRTLQRAVTSVPFFIPAGQIFRIDITGIDEELPPDYTLPAWKAPAIDENPADNPFTIFQAPVEIFATPQPVASIPLADTIISASDVASVTIDPLTKLRTLTLVNPRASWTTANLTGKQVIDAANPSFNSVIAIVLSTTSILLTIDHNPTFPLQIVEPSAHLHGSGTNFGTIRANNVDCIGFTGIKITSDNGFNGLVTDGNGTCMCQMCELDSPFVVQASGTITFSNVNRVIRSWVYNFPSFAGPTLIGESLFDAVLNFGPLFSTPIILTLLRTAIIGSDPIEVVTFEPGGNLDGSAPAHILVKSVLFQSGSGDGFIFHGVKGHIVNADFAGNSGNGITVNRGGGLLSLENVGSNSPNGNFGIQIEDGMQVVVDAATSGNATPLTGSLGGDILLGSVGPVPWATVAAPPNNVADYAGPSATGARISQQ